MCNLAKSKRRRRKKRSCSLYSVRKMWERSGLDDIITERRRISSAFLETKAILVKYKIGDSINSWSRPIKIDKRVLVYVCVDCIKLGVKRCNGTQWRTNGGRSGWYAPDLWSQNTTKPLKNRLVPT